MMMEFENEIKIGNGIYTVSDVAKILRLPYHKVNYWVDRYWDGKFGQAFEERYSWTIDTSKAVSFHTLVEFYILIQFAEAGVKTKEVLKAHMELSEAYNTAFPFANKDIISKINTDGLKIYLDINNNTIQLDGTKQFKLKFIHDFFKNLDFDDSHFAVQLWPLGKEKSIVIDPVRQFGHPVIHKTNIFPETLFNMYQAGEPTNFIAFTFELEEGHIHDAIEFCTAA